MSTDLTLYMTEKIRLKLANRGIADEHIIQCFLNRDRTLLRDEREFNKTIPPTWTFISKTDSGRVLKIAFMVFADRTVDIKTAFEPNSDDVQFYLQHSESL